MITSKLIKTNELPIPPPVIENEEVEISFQFSKTIKSKSLSETHELLSKKIAIRVVEDRIVVKNEPKPNTTPPVVEQVETSLKGLSSFCFFLASKHPCLTYPIFKLCSIK